VFGFSDSNASRKTMKSFSARTALSEATSKDMMSKHFFIRPHNEANIDIRGWDSAKRWHSPLDEMVMFFLLSP